MKARPGHGDGCDLQRTLERKSWARGPRSSQPWRWGWSRSGSCWRDLRGNQAHVPPPQCTQAEKFEVIILVKMRFKDSQRTPTHKSLGKSLSKPCPKKPILRVKSQRGIPILTQGYHLIFGPRTFSYGLDKILCSMTKIWLSHFITRFGSWTKNCLKYWCLTHFYSPWFSLIVLCSWTGGSYSCHLSISFYHTQLDSFFKFCVFRQSQTSSAKMQSSFSCLSLQEHNTDTVYS